MALAAVSNAAIGPLDTATLTIRSDAEDTDPAPQVVRPGQAYTQDFSAGQPNGSDGWEYRSTSDGRIRVVEGRLRMDDTVRPGYSLNEAILHVDLAGQTGVQLSLDHWRLRDERHPLPATFAGHANGDGIAVSADGITWYTVQGLDLNRDDRWVVDLDEVIAKAGISYTHDFQIKIQQYDNHAAPTDGREWDNVRVEVLPPVTPQAVRPGQAYTQDFSAGQPNRPDGWEYHSTSDGRIQVVAGRLRMDDTVRGGYSLNEAILHVDLAGQTGVQLSVDHWRLGDERHPLPATFTGHANGDGIAVSADGVTWHTVQGLNLRRDLRWMMDLDAVIADLGISYTDDFQIKLQQYDNHPAGIDGREWDKVQVEIVPSDGGPRQGAAESDAPPLRSQDVEGVNPYSKFVGLDVNGDDDVTPVDVLRVITYRNAATAGSQVDANTPDEDVNRDGFVSPLDALAVINYLNAGPSPDSPFAEIPVSGTADSNRFGGNRQRTGRNNNPWFQRC